MLQSLNISTAVNIISHKNELPRKKDWNQVKRLIRYLKNPKYIDLIINSKAESVLTSFTMPITQDTKQTENIRLGIPYLANLKSCGLLKT